MKLIDRIKVDIPCWAASAIANDDWSGLTDDEEREVRAWFKTLVREREGLVWDIVFSSNCDAFNPFPAFGDACDTCEAEVVYYAKEHELDSLTHYINDEGE